MPSLTPPLLPRPAPNPGGQGGGGVGVQDIRTTATDSTTWSEATCPPAGWTGYLPQNPATTMPVVRSKFLSQGLDPFGCGNWKNIGMALSRWDIFIGTKRQQPAGQWHFIYSL